MQPDLDRQIGELIERGAQPVSFGEVSERSVAAGSGARRKTGRRRAAIGGVTAGIAVAGCAVALLIEVPPFWRAWLHPGAAVHPRAAVHPGSPSPETPAILTAAMVQHVAAASRSALASSGREQITYQNRKNGAVDGHGNDVITFSGGNYNWVMDDQVPPSASPQVVCGRDSDRHHSRRQRRGLPPARSERAQVASRLRPPVACHRVLPGTADGAVAAVTAGAVPGRRLAGDRWGAAPASAGDPGQRAAGQPDLRRVPAAGRVSVCP